MINVKFSVLLHRSITQLQMHSHSLLLLLLPPFDDDANSQAYEPPVPRLGVGAFVIRAKAFLRFVVAKQKVGRISFPPVRMNEQPWNAAGTVSHTLWSV